MQITDSMLARATRTIGTAGFVLGMALAFSAQAAPGSSNGKGTQGPADSTQAQGMQGMQGTQQAQGNCSREMPADNAIVGKSLTEAKSLLQGCPWRIGEQDGKAMPLTRDHRPERRTLTIENDKVTNVTRG
ncbi:hypothetical protein PIN31009_04439 [Pandoraea iniqua]|uniref:hypothetical protein n=1 Tax=Pandoraea iniqua TaxID=2508288 RepID=UPI00123FC143|nr:hypothetical protein [Pandoraea iniqua]VVE47188.1 hypothetical protein PIN31009_04439 [Pandoraea iniqua]